MFFSRAVPAMVLRQPLQVTNGCVEVFQLLAKMLQNSCEIHFGSFLRIVFFSAKTNQTTPRLWSEKKEQALTLYCGPMEKGILRQLRRIRKSLQGVERFENALQKTVGLRDRGL
jgi:hypothetical protein